MFCEGGSALLFINTYRQFSNVFFNAVNHFIVVLTVAEDLVKSSGKIPV